MVDRARDRFHTSLASLADLVDRLSSQAEIAGIALSGSHAAGRETPWSDLDLLLVFAGTQLPFTHVTTTVGDTLTEIVCCTTADIHAAAEGDMPAHWDRATFIRLLGGRVLFDRDGSLGEAARWAAAQPAPGPDEDPYGRWRHAQYNARQTRRYLASGDAAARAAVVARMLYSLHDILRDYFTLRRMAWPGDKEALMYWHEHERALRSAWLAAVAEPDVTRKVAAREALFPHVYAPLGGGPDLTGDLIQPADNATVAHAAGTWTALIGRGNERATGDERG